MGTTLIMPQTVKRNHQIDFAHFQEGIVLRKSFRCLKGRSIALRQAKSRKALLLLQGTDTVPGKFLQVFPLHNKSLKCKNKACNSILWAM